MSLLRKVVDWFVGDGRQSTFHCDVPHLGEIPEYHPVPSAPATADDHLRWVRNPPPTQKSLDELLAIVTRVRIVDAGMDPISGESLDGQSIADVTAPAQVAALRANLAIIEDPEPPPVHCRCLGSPTLELYAGDAQRAGVALHHGESIRWNRWEGNAPLANPLALLQVMAALGAEGPLREFQHAHGPDSGVAGRIAGTNWVDLKLWRPSPGWESLVGPAATRLERDPGDVLAWGQLAMMLGDSGAPDLALIACLHARRLPASETDRERVTAHLIICLLQLGLGRPTYPGLIPAISLGDPDGVLVFEGRLEGWIVRHLAVFDGDLARAADFALHLALARTGLRNDEPDLFATN